MLLLLIGFLTGCLITALSIGAGILFWHYSKSEFVGKNREEDEESPFIQPHLPQVPNLLRFHVHGEWCISFLVARLVLGLVWSVAILEMVSD